MNEYRITGLELNGVGVFDRLDLSFPEKKPEFKDKAEIHIFTGINGTGKTTLLQALTYFDRKINVNYYAGKVSNGIYVHPIEQKWNFTNKKRTQEDELRIKFFNDQFNTNPGTSRDNIPGILQDYSKKLNYANYPDLQYAFFAYTGQRQIVNSQVQILKTIDINALIDALDITKTEIAGLFFQWVANIKTKAALHFMKENGKSDNNSFSKTISKVEKSLSEILGRDISLDLDEKDLQVKVTIANKPVSFNLVAEGYKSIISWLGDIVFRLDTIGFNTDSPFALFLDEIDVHLHPAAQRKILPVIQKLFPNAQIFLTTHSPFVLGSVDGAWIYKFKFDEEGNSVLDGEPEPSEAGHSYNYFLQKIFNIKDRFGIEVEKQLTEFYIGRDELIKKPNSDSGDFLKLSRDLAMQSIELQSIIGSELHQLSRIIKKDISI